MFINYYLKLLVTVLKIFRMTREQERLRAYLVLKLNNTNNYGTRFGINKENPIRATLHAFFLRNWVNMV